MLHYVVDYVTNMFGKVLYFFSSQNVRLKLLIGGGGGGGGQGCTENFGGPGQKFLIRGSEVK